jgi:hypothetical protein
MKSFPMLTKAFKEIDGDNGNFYILDPMIEKPTQRWLGDFETAEAVLKRLDGIKLTDILTKKALKQFYEIVGSKRLTGNDNSAFWWVVASVDDCAEQIMKAAGINKNDAKIVEEVLYQYFDGDLSGELHVENTNHPAYKAIFSVKRKGARKGARK